MKKYLFIFLTFFLTLSCVEKGDGIGGGGGSTLYECVIPASVTAGKDAAVQWNGFTESPVLLLVSEDGKEYEVEIEIVTSSGLIFNVPANVPAGTYMLVLVHDGRIELGILQVLEPESPLSGISFPSGAEQGETVVVEGVGFEDGCHLIFVGKGSEEISVDVLIVSQGISFIVPEDMEEGKYQVYLVQNGISWILTKSFSVHEDLVIKQLVGLNYYAPYIGTSEIMLSWEISAEGPVTLKVSEYIISGDEITLNAYDTYVSDDSGYFSLEHDGFEMSNDLGMSYEFDEEGKVSRSDVLIYGDDDTTPFEWTYDKEGRLVDISSPKRSFRSLSYEDGNLTVFRQTSFVYDDPSLFNNPAASDVVWGYMSLMEKNDPFVYFPYLLGWYKTASELLPSKMLLPSPTGEGVVECALAYEYDADGYVTLMSWNEGTSLYRIEYLYHF